MTEKSKAEFEWSIKFPIEGLTFMPIGVPDNYPSKAFYVQTEFFALDAIFRGITAEKLCKSCEGKNDAG